MKKDRPYIDWFRVIVTTVVVSIILFLLHLILLAIGFAEEAQYYKERKYFEDVIDTVPGSEVKIIAREWYHPVGMHNACYGVEFYVIRDGNEVFLGEAEYVPKYSNPGQPFIQGDYEIINLETGEVIIRWWYDGEKQQAFFNIPEVREYIDSPNTAETLPPAK